MQDESLPSPSARLGFGMLRIDPNEPRHREALREALLRGVDLFDLGDFAGDPARFAEKRRALLGLVAEHAAGPVRLLVRGGLGDAARFDPRETVVPGGPRARVEWVYLVSDPEFALPSLEWDHARLYALLAGELDHLEALSARGAIAGYGVGSAGFAYAKEDPEALALEPLVLGRESLEWDAEAPAERPANRTGFRYVEFPFNLYESAAAAVETQLVGARPEPLLSAARRFGLATIARRPFDAVTEDGLRRLVAYPDHHRLDLHEAVRLTLETALAEEAEFLGRRNHARAQAGVPAAELDPLWAHRLRDQLRHVVDPEQWKEILRRRIEPELAAVREPSARYLDAMKALTLAVRLWCEKAAAERNERLRAKLFEAAPTLARRRGPGDRDLALVALRIYRSIPELDYVLVGMRSPNYVRSLTAAAADPAPGLRLGPEEVRAALIAAHAALRPDALPTREAGSAREDSPP